MINPKVLNDALEIQRRFDTAQPFRHIEIDNFLTTDACRTLLSDFPSFDKKYAINEHGEVGGKAVVEHVSDVSPFYKSFFEYINSTEFLNAISDLTGIPDLIADETLFGGGTHENRHGQALDVHVDFNIDERRMLHRRLNLLIYLNEEWESDWGGLIELHSNPWDQGVNQVQRFLPLFNKALIFETNEYSWHGFERIQLPESKQHLSRKSFSIYLYTRDRPAEEVVAPHTTFYVPAPLPRHLVAGHQLSDQDQTQLQILMASRDGLIRMYQKLLIEKEQRIRDFVKSKQRVVEPTYLPGSSTQDKTIRNCPVCGREGHEATWIGKLETTAGSALKQPVYDLVQCGGCTLVYLSPAPPPEDLKAIYVDSTQFEDPLYTDSARIAAINEYLSSCLSRILSTQGKAADAHIKVLEVGAGMAWMSRAAKSLQPQSITTAQDITAEAATKCAWVDHYIHGEVVDPRIAAGAPYDVISLTHVIEHLMDPVSVIKQCAEMLSPDGIIFITAPHRPLGWREFSRNILPWQQGSYTHVPAHIQYFSEASMRSLALKTGCRVVAWSAEHEQGQALEAWIGRGTEQSSPARPPDSALSRIARGLSRRWRRIAG
jgi:SAM-dependent methyltransferase